MAGRGDDDLEANFRSSLRDFKTSSSTTSSTTSSPTSTFSFTNILSSLDNARKESTETISGSAKSLFSTIQNAPKTFTNATDPVAAETCGMSRMQRYALFLLFLFSGLMSFSIAFVTLPMVVLFPAKFALSYTFGSLLILSSFGFLRGPVTHFKSLISTPITILYVTSMIATLYATLVSKNYILIILFSIAQIIALVWYLASYLPGGVEGLAKITSYLTSFLTSSFGRILGK